MSFTLKINNQTIGDNTPPYIIAEVSANHNGSLKKALQAIKIAKECGVNAVKIQTYTPDNMTIQSAKEDFKIKQGLWKGHTLYSLYQEAQTPYEWHKELFEYANSIGVTLFSTPFDESGVDLLESLNTPAYKIASFEMIDLPLLKYVAQTKKPVILSTGMATFQEIQEAVQTLMDNGCKHYVLLHCISAYPAPVDQANLKTIPDLIAQFNCPVGLSDHTLTNTAAITAIALGACVIEKHFTLDRNDKGPDSAFSLEPNELKCLCSESFSAWSALGQVNYQLKPAEKDNIIFRRSLYFVKDIKKGSKIKPDDMRRIRPGYGLPPKYFDELIGRTVNQDIQRGTAINWELIDDK